MFRVEDRYRNDPTFHAAVDGLQRLVLELQLSPSEVREAAMFACYLIECRHPRPIAMAIPHPPAPLEQHSKDTKEHGPQ